MIHGEIHVIIPDINLPKTMINALIKGYDECPDEFYFMSLDRVTDFVFFIMMFQFAFFCSGAGLCLRM